MFFSWQSVYNLVHFIIYFCYGAIIPPFVRLDVHIDQSYASDRGSIWSAFYYVCLVVGVLCMDTGICFLYIALHI